MKSSGIPTLIGLALILASNSAPGAGQGRQDYVGYRARENALTEVYETAGNWVTFGGPGILGPRRAENEFAGPIASCGDAQFHCFASVLRVAVPRWGIMPSWSAGGHGCRIIDGTWLPPDRTVRILCRTNEEQSVEFTYSRRRGIESYRRQCPGCFDGEYVLVTEIGLFASPDAQ